MYKIAFFCIPAHGHINPTLEVVRQLTDMGNEVHYYSYHQFKDKIEAAGAEFISCDSYDVQLNLRPEDGEKIAKDIAFSIKLLTETTLALDEMVCRSLREWKPHCIIADSMAVWGKFAALKLNIPFISSTTTFAFNRYSSRIMKQSFSQLFSLLRAMPSVNRDIKRLKAHGYPVKNMLSMIQNDNDTNTIVYTSKEFQPCADTFSDRYVFVGPSIKDSGCAAEKTGRIRLYISMGTVIHNMSDFYKNCIEAFKNSDYEIIMSVGENTDLSQFNNVPPNITIKNKVNQIEVLKDTQVFLTHCGMNSVSEGLYYAVPLVLYPQTVEEGGVALRVEQLNAGIPLKENSPESIRQTVETVLSEKMYKENAKKISESFRCSGGPLAAAEAVLNFIEKTNSK